ncbi:histidine phosphatase family protein [Sphingomonas sp. BK235]|uniref:histidine phosphatase family protein n=1 Tax=Sphingomonas sp. BK235 TaxID=2512131 RepID=UPI0010E74B5C|nr:histidine phosphatase family protein [Sphingomonas sp. BK235]TCP32748.1 alpha-ribazole phosphatase [Sphingomonas sp. BK235]
MTAAITLHLMRHGATAADGRLIGHHDAPVTAAGIAACVAAAAPLSVARVVTSDLARAAACGGAIAAARTVPVRADPRWRELDFGEWEGRRPDTIDPAALAAFWHDPDVAPPPGGERWSALTARVGAALTEVADATLVVAHAGAIRAALAVTCGLDARQVWAVELHHAGVVSLRLWRSPAPVAQIVALR